jgi:hypothetical protein
MYSYNNATYGSRKKLSTGTNKSLGIKGLGEGGLVQSYYFKVA